jgi:hypothetical protein
MKNPNVIELNKLPQTYELDGQFPPLICLAYLGLCGFYAYGIIKGQEDNSINMQKCFTLYFTTTSAFFSYVLYDVCSQKHKITTEIIKIAEADYGQEIVVQLGTTNYEKMLWNTVLFYSIFAYGTSTLDIESTQSILTSAKYFIPGLGLYFSSCYYLIQGMIHHDTNRIAPTHYMKPVTNELIYFDSCESQEIHQDTSIFQSISI